MDSIRLLTNISLRRWALLHSLIIDLNDSQSASPLVSLRLALIESALRYSKIGTFFFLNRLNFRKFL